MVYLQMFSSAIIRRIERFRWTSMWCMQII